MFNLSCSHLTYSLTGASCVCARNVISSHARLLVSRTQSKLSHVIVLMLRHIADTLSDTSPTQLITRALSPGHLI